ncbi:hypothetical protein PV797_09550 [Clostridiaceae bacterium M8S5]|nr:hypothetical protein PV797_09550 [Clostridiaceae bacterium M8S5]
MQKACDKYNYSRNVTILPAMQSVTWKNNMLILDYKFEITNLDLREIPCSQIIIESNMPVGFSVEDIEITNVSNVRYRLLNNNSLVALGELNSINCNCTIPVDLKICLSTKSTADIDFISDLTASVQIDKLIANSILLNTSYENIREARQIATTTLALNTGNELTRNVGLL